MTTQTVWGKRKRVRRTYACSRCKGRLGSTRGGGACGGRVGTLSDLASKPSLPTGSESESYKKQEFARLFRGTLFSTEQKRKKQTEEESESGPRAMTADPHTTKKQSVATSQHVSHTSSSVSGTKTYTTGRHSAQGVYCSRASYYQLERQTHHCFSYRSYYA